MTELAPGAAAALPLFHHTIVPLNAERHAGLRLNRDAGYGFSAGTATVPICIGEFEQASYSYPILFTDDSQPRPIVLLGVRPGWNLFVDAAGAWMPRAYVPALVRAFPFLFIRDPETGERAVGVEADAACLSPTTGLPLFESGQPTAAVKEAVALCEACEAEMAESAAFATALAEAGLLVPQEAAIDTRNGASARISGFRTVDRGRFGALPDDVLLEWRRRNWLLPLYAHFFSAAKWAPFTEFASERLEARA